MSRRAPGGEPLEIEVKLAVTRPRLIARLLRDPDLNRLAGFVPASAPTLVVVTDSYLDTTSGPSLMDLGMRARLRRTGRDVTLTVKRPGEMRDGMTFRVELEGPATPSLHADRWPASAARTALLGAIESAQLAEVARLRQHRLTRLVRRGRTTVELSLDRVDAMIGDRVLDRRYELEAELKRGDPEALAELTDALARLDGLGPPVGSKLAFALSVR